MKKSMIEKLEEQARVRQAAQHLEFLPREAAWIYLGIGHSQFDEQTRAGVIKTMRYGGKLVVAVKELDRWESLHRQADELSKPPLQIVHA